MKYFLLLTLVFNLSALADDHHHHHKHKKHKKHESKKSLGAHEHGHAELNFAVEGSQLFVEFHSPGEGVLGFEHSPKTAAEKKKVKDLETLWSSSVGKLFAISGADCKAKNLTFDMEQEDGHSEVKASALLACSKELKGTSLKVSLLEQFKGVKKLKVKGLLPGKAYTKTLKDKSFTIKM